MAKNSAFDRRKIIEALKKLKIKYKTEYTVFLDKITIKEEKIKIKEKNPNRENIN